MNNLVLSKTQHIIGDQILKRNQSSHTIFNGCRIRVFNIVKTTGTLSGGEAQRIRLATQIGSGLVGVAYILDEPSIGLHQRDNQRLINSLLEMRDLGNSLIVVEHDTDTMLQADYLIDIGPGAGEHGGYVVAKGTPEEVMNNPDSLTGRYLKGIEKNRSAI